MVRICICWEYGTGYGHLIRYREVIARLKAADHRVAFIARVPRRAAEVFVANSPAIHAAPLGETPPERRIRMPNSFPEILLNCGFEDVAALTARLRAWCDLVRGMRPDLLVSDFSPSALMAARAFGIPAVVCGSGFYSPPLLRPMPALRRWLPRDDTRLRGAEQRVVANVNAALTAVGGAPVSDLADLYTVAEHLLLTVPEFDPYPDRQGVTHLGTFSDAGFGRPPRWPSGNGPAVFAYLHPGVLLPEILAALASLAARVCLFAPGIDRAALSALRQRPALELMAEPVDVAAAAAASAAMVTNANLNTVISGLQAGTPQLVVPYNLEKFLTGRCLEELGAGLSAPRLAPGDIRVKLKEILEQAGYRGAAGRFAAKYREHGATKPEEAMYDAFRRCMAQDAA